MSKFVIKRIYATAEKSDGYRVLVDRLWPRGLKKENAAIDEWAKNLAPSNELRLWFAHKDEHWKVFMEKYKEELKNNKEIEEFIKTHKQKKLITLLFAAKHEQHNHAIILQEYLASF